MVDVTVRCGCSRTMQTDTFAGGGRYRCSCGTRIGITGLPKFDATHCSLFRSGRICNGPKLAEDPVCQPCSILIAKIAMTDRDVVEQLASTMAAVDFHQEQAAKLEARREQERIRSENFEQRDDARRCCVVYYCRIRPGIIKIGTSIQLAARMDNFRIPAEDVLAAEPGSYKLESLRHRQFTHLRIAPKREDFRLDDQLQEHMDNLVRTHGQPYDLVATIYERQLKLASRGSQS